MILHASRRALRIERERDILGIGRHGVEVIRSLASPGAERAGPRDLPALARSHRHIESRLRHARDSAADEDRRQARVRRLPRSAIPPARPTPSSPSGAATDASASRARPTDTMPPPPGRPSTRSRPPPLHEPAGVSLRSVPGRGSVKGRMSALGLVRLWAPVFLGLAFPMPGAADADPPIVFDLTLEDAIGRALERNRSLLDRRADREVRRFSLEVVEDRWRPRLTVAPFASRDRRDRRAGVGAETRLRIPTGGEFTLRWEEARSGEFDDSRTQTLRFSQPLLKGAWAGIDSAEVRRARIAERIDVLALREAVADLVVEVAGAYRSLIGAARQVEIGETSLRRAREQLEATRTLIRAGRVAEREAVRSEAAVAKRELALARTRNRLDAANAALIAILDLGSTVRVRPLDGLRAEPGQGAPGPGLDEVLHRRADYHQARLRVDTARIGLAVARNRLLPDLSVGLEMSRRDAGRTDTMVRLDAVIPFNDRSPELERLRARTELRKAERALAGLRESVGIALRRAVDDVEVGLRLTELARGARALAEENLAIEKKKFGQGLSSSFEVAASEDELVQAEQAEADTIIAWLDALTRLDRVAGRTLERWGIGLEAVER